MAIPGLLAQGNPLFDFGLGLLSAAGPSTMPTSIGQGMLQGAQFASARDRTRLENEMIRGRMLQQQQQQRAAQELTGLLGRNVPFQTPETQVAGMEGEQLGTIPGFRGEMPAINTPEGQREMLGLLSQVAPEQVAQGLLGQVFPSEDRGTSFLREMAALNVPVEEARELWMRKFQEGGTMEELDRMLKMMTLQEMQTRRAESERTAAEQQRNQEMAVYRGIRNLTRLVELNDKLENTVLETGVGMEQGRRAAMSGIEAVRSLFGVRDDRARELIADFDEFEQLATKDALENISIFAGTGPVSQQKFQALMALSPGLSRSPEANRRGFADMLEVTLDMADYLSLPIENQRQLRSKIGRLRGTERGTEFVYDPATGQIVPR